MPTRPGLPAIEELTRRGVNVNVTLLFSIDRYEEVVDAYLRGITARAQAGEPVDGVRSVASFFLSRIDTKVVGQLPDGSPLRGRVALACARVAYQRYLAKFAGAQWREMERPGARRQRPLWASTGTKNPDYPDILYVAELIGPDVVNTMPEHTLRAFANHCQVARTLDADPEGAEKTLAAAAAAGIDLAAVTDGLEREGVAIVLRFLSPVARLHRGQACRGGIGGRLTRARLREGSRRDTAEPSQVGSRSRRANSASSS